MSRFKVGDRVYIRPFGAATPREVREVLSLVLPTGAQYYRLDNECFYYKEEELCLGWAAPLAPNAAAILTMEDLGLGPPACKHKWVLYQPFQGEAYTCCANAGCGIQPKDVPTAPGAAECLSTDAWAEAWYDYNKSHNPRKTP